MATKLLIGSFAFCNQPGQPDNDKPAGKYIQYNEGYPAGDNRFIGNRNKRVGKQEQQKYAEKDQLLIFFDPVHRQTKKG
jgi:hypothetical protein